MMKGPFRRLVFTHSARTSAVYSSFCHLLCLLRAFRPGKRASHRRTSQDVHFLHGTSNSERQQLWCFEDGGCALNLVEIFSTSKYDSALTGSSLRRRLFHTMIGINSIVTSLSAQSVEVQKNKIEIQETLQGQRDKKAKTHLRSVGPVGSQAKAFGNVFVDLAMDSASVSPATSCWYRVNHAWTTSFMRNAFPIFRPGLIGSAIYEDIGTSGTSVALPDGRRKYSLQTQTSKTCC